MHLLALSQDKNVIEPSTTQERIASYGAIVDSLTVVLFGVGTSQDISLGGNVRIVSAGGRSKFSAIFLGVVLLWKEAGTGRYDLMTTQNPFWMGVVALAVAYVKSLPLQTQIHTDCFSRAYMTESLWRAAESLLARFVVRHSSCVRTVSKRVAKSIARYARVSVGIVPVRVSDIPNVRTSTPRHSPVFLFLTVSRLTHEKRIHILLEALARVSGAELTIVGDGPLGARLQARAHSLGISDRVHFVGWAKDTTPYYQNADAYVQASRYEGYGLSLVEAALSALPIVSTDVGIIGDILLQDADVLVVPGDVDAFARAMKQLMNDSPRAMALGASAEAKARNHLLSEEAYLAAYKNALSLCDVRPA